MSVVGSSGPRRAFCLKPVFTPLLNGLQASARHHTLVTFLEHGAQFVARFLLGLCSTPTHLAISIARQLRPPDAICILKDRSFAMCSFTHQLLLRWRSM